MIAFHPPIDALVGLLGGLAATFGWLWVLRRDRAGAWLIRAPKLGILNLLATAGTAWAAEDAGALVPFFDGVRESDATTPRCDVLMLYCDVAHDGTIVHDRRRLREIVRESKAQIVIVASPNVAADYMEAMRETGFGTANVVLTLDRKGPAFARFFVRLFERMRAATPMPVAWVELQPQDAGAVRPEHPDLVCLMERGHVAFAPSSPDVVRRAGRSAA